MIETTSQLQTLFKYLASLVRNPVQEIQRIPDIQWKTLIIFQFCLSFISVGISNLLAPFAISFTNVLISLAASSIAIALASLFFYYFFLILYNQKLSFIKIFSLVLFAHIPFAVFHLASFFFPPADLIGLGISGLLMIIGLVENFSIPKKLATRLIISLYAVLSIYWVIHLITMREFAQTSNPQDLDKIEKEVNDFFKE